MGHPDPGSLNHAVAQRISSTWAGLGFSAEVVDLHAAGFDPVMTAAEFRGGPSQDPQVQQYQQALHEADLLAVVHPNQWGAPPALVKGWMDRVFAEGAAYAFAKGEDAGDAPIPLLVGKRGLIVNTSNTTAEREADTFGDPLERIWRDCLLGYSGFERIDRLVLRVVATSTPSERAAWLVQVEEAATEVIAGSAS